MNNKRREWLKEISDKLSSLKDELSNVLDEENEYFDNMPIGLQSSENGENSQTAISCMDNAVCQIEDALEQLAEIN